MSAELNHLSESELRTRLARAEERYDELPDDAADRDELREEITALRRELAVRVTDST